MFAPAPRSHHISRTYGHPTTSKKNTNKENAHALPSKTPSRAGLVGKQQQLIGPSTGIRLGLGPKTEGRDRNVLLGQQSALGKGKGKEGDDIEPKRLFTNAPQKSGSIPPSKSLSSMPQILARGPSTSNTHRTPGPVRRQAPAPVQPLRTPAPSQMSYEPAPTPLPSATRNRRRSRPSISSSFSQSGALSQILDGTPLKSTVNDERFTTPAPSGKWEEEISLESIEEHMEGLQLGSNALEGVLEEEDDDEVEYMPPPVQELPWTPAWDVPDLAEVFSTLAKMPPLWTNYDAKNIVVPELVVNYVDEHGLTLKGDEESEDPLFRPKVKSVPVQSTQSQKQPISRIGGAKLSRPTTTSTIPSVRKTLPSSALALKTQLRSVPKAPLPTARRPNPTIQKPREAVIDEADQELFDSWGLELSEDVVLNIDV